MKRLIPQWVARLYCRLRYKHAVIEFEPVAMPDPEQPSKTVLVTVTTCRCGGIQTAKVTKGQFPRRRFPGTPERKGMA